MTDFFKGALWEHGTVNVDGKQMYKTVIVGVVLTDKPLGCSDSRTIAEGRVFGLSSALHNIPTRPSNEVLGEASDVLTRLGKL